MEINKKHQFNFVYFIIAFFVVLAIQNWIQSRPIAKISYSEFLELLKQKEISEVVVTDTAIEGTFKKPQDGKTKFITTRVDPQFANDLEKSGVKFSGEKESTFVRDLLSWIVPILLFFGIWMFFIRRMAEKQGLGGMMNVGKSKAKVYVEKETGVTFDDIAGVDEAEQELEEVVSFLKDKELYSRLGARIPKGILLVGPPGTGKTLLARAVAGQAGVPFFSISGSEFVEMFVGVGAARVRDLFQQAQKAAPCIIFIDEIDALGRRGGDSVMGGHSEKEQTLNQLLTELDGFDAREGIVLLAATNRPEILDPALLRAGRFDRQVVVDRPDRSGRIEILKIHLKGIKVADDVDPETIAGLTPGFTGADLENLVNEAAIFATRRNGELVRAKDFTAAVERIIAGTEKKSRVLNPSDRRRVAFHEMGHALAAANLPDMDPVHKVSIIPRSIGALGYTMQQPTEDKFLITSDELKNRMAVLLAGRAAEDIVFGEISTGAADDLSKATDIARQFVTRFGMSEEVGQVKLEDDSSRYLGNSAFSMEQRNYSEETAREIDLAIRRLVDEAYENAKYILETRRKDLDAGANILLDKETITPNDFPPLNPKKSMAQEAAE